MTVGGVRLEVLSADRRRVRQVSVQRLVRGRRTP
jgi:CBS domain containing-hemolysin-like protein